jgi:hypothetical protein
MAESQSTSLRKCSKCGEEKPTDQFNARKNRGGKLHHWCRACGNRYRRALYAKLNPPDNSVFESHFAVPGREFRDADGFPNYRVGNDGSVWSCYRSAGAGRGKIPSAVWSRLSPDIGELGHMRVHLYLNGNRLRVLVHHLVLRAFVGPRPEGMEGCHWDGDPTNNSLLNLRWDTSQGNWADRKRHGRGRSWSKLTTDEVRAVRDLDAAGMLRRDIASLFGISDTQVSNICNGKQWKEGI